MTTGPTLWPIVVCLFVVLLAPTLLFATTLLEHLITPPAPNPEVTLRQRADVPINRKER